MNKFAKCMTMAAAALLLTISAAAQQIAITVDDLPQHGALPPGVTKQQVAAQWIKALKDVGAPPVYGMVNGKMTEWDPTAIEVLKQWRAAGNLLGNHTWAHTGFSKETLEQFLDELDRNDKLIEPLMQGEDRKWLRWPYLDEGGSDAAKAAAGRKALAERGYKVATVTMGAPDYAYNEVWVRCEAKGDHKSAATVEEDYLKAVAADADYRRQAAKLVVGHDIPYVLLMHIGSLEAKTLPKILALYKQKGFTLVTLDKAEQDPFYQYATHLQQPAGPDSLEWAAGVKGVQLPAGYATPLDLNAMCR